jgi:hypothetical protein
MLAEVSALKTPRPAFAPLLTHQFGINHQNWVNKVSSKVSHSHNYCVFLIKFHFMDIVAFLNPLTPALNPSEQHCLLGFFTGDFKFYFLVFGKKSISHRLFLQI